MYDSYALNALGHRTVKNHHPIVTEIQNTPKRGGLPTMHGIGRRTALNRWFSGPGRSAVNVCLHDGSQGSTWSRISWNGRRTPVWEVHAIALRLLRKASAARPMKHIARGWMG